MSTDLDPRWDWIECPDFVGTTQYVRGLCRHLEVVPVESGGETVAHLCITCDTQLPEEWTS
jgi:hypothetical protein